MPLYTLLREYEERRQALIDQLKNNPDMDPAVQHQIYGAIKEIENFLKTVEFQIASSREQSISIELERDRPRPLVDRTKKFAGKVKKGAKKVTGAVASGTKHVVTSPKRFLTKQRKRREMRQQIEREMLARLQHSTAMSGELPQHVHETQQPTSHLPQMEAVEETLRPDLTSTAGDERLPVDEPRIEAEPSFEETLGDVVEPPRAKPVKKKAKKASKKKSVKNAKKKPVRKSSKKKVVKKKTAKKSKKSTRKSSKKKAVKKTKKRKR